MEKKRYQNYKIFFVDIAMFYLIFIIIIKIILK